jgi:outer membrane biosynthesis protein TonB
MNTTFFIILLLILLVLVFLAHKQEQRDKAYFENTHLKDDFSEEVSLTHVQEVEEPITGETIVAIAEEIVNPPVETSVETPVETPKKKKSKPRKKPAPKKKED